MPDGQRVIGLSGRGKRLDKVLITLLHEVAHIILGHVDEVAIVDDSEDQPPASPRHPRAVIRRILPGEDIIEASEKVCLSEGITHGLIRASLGSIVGACRQRPDGELLMDGPATEIITLAGSVLPDTNGSVQASASAVVVDRHGQVHAGPLIRGHNPVAVTFELLIIEEDEHQ